MKTKLICWSNEPHLSQIYTGLSMLHRAGRIDLETRIVAPPPPNLQPACPPHLRYAERWHCRIEANGRSLYVDVHDDDDICKNGLDCDVYLKRSYNLLARHPPKVQPLGLNYDVYVGGFDRFELERRFRLEGTWRAGKYLLRRPIGLSELEAPPSKAEPRVLFLCRTWEPEPDRATDKNAERIYINGIRAACIIALREEFGDRCIAGFAHNQYAAEHYPQALAVDPRMTERRRFLQLVRAIPICVGTMGLHASNGWKLGEYVAFSRAIACEPLRHHVPGFLPDRHYIPFRSAEECVKAVELLMSSAAARQSMAEANREYYLRHLRPDVMMLRVLTGLSGSVSAATPAQVSEPPWTPRAKIRT